MARLEHPNVVTVYEVGYDGGRDYIAMELVDGATSTPGCPAAPPAPTRSWRALLAAGPRARRRARRRPRPPRLQAPQRAARPRRPRASSPTSGSRAGSAMTGPPARRPPPRQTPPHVAGAPRSRPGRIALDVTVEAAPSDTPATRSQPSGRRSDAVLDSPLTEPGALIGTPAYMAPEQYVGASPDPRTDQFAFCVTAWQALTGRRPFQGETLAELRACGRRGRRERPREAAPGGPGRARARARPSTRGALARSRRAARRARARPPRPAPAARARLHGVRDRDGDRARARDASPVDGELLERDRWLRAR